MRFEKEKKLPMKAFAGALVVVACGPAEAPRCAVGDARAVSFVKRHPAAFIH